MESWKVGCTFDLSINRGVCPANLAKMTTLNNTINAQIVYDLLKSAHWDWEHCGRNVDQDTMRSYVSDIEDNITLLMVDKKLSEQSEYILNDFDNDGDINRWAAVYIADSVGQQSCNCIYETVTFFVNL